MLIGIDASRAIKKNKTGTEWYSWHLIKALGQLDQENEYFLYTHKKSPQIAEGFSSGQNKVLVWPPRWLWTQIRLSAEMLLNAPELLFVPSHVLPLIHPKKTVVTLHDIAFERYPEAYSQLGKAYLRFTTKFALKHASKIIVPSEFTRSELIRVYKAEADKIQVIYHGYNEKNYRLINDEVRSQEICQKYGIEGPFIIYVGRLETKKNISNLIKACKLLNRKVQLVLVGHPGHGYAQIKPLLSADIIRPGWVGEEELPYLYSKAEAFVFPSLYEGFGLPVLEAMACGCPVVASRIPALQEVVGQAALLVDGEDFQGLAKAIDRILEGKNLQEELKARGLERVKNFSWQKCGQETLAVLESV